MSGDCDGVSPENVLYVSICIVLLLFFCFFFSWAEAAVMYTNESKLKVFEAKNKGVWRVMRLREGLPFFSATVRSVTVITGLLTVLLAMKYYVPLLAVSLQSIPFLNGAEQLTADITVFVLCAFVIIVVGHLLPQRLAFFNPEKTALRLSKPIRFLRNILFPLVWLLTICTNFLVRLFGKNPHKMENTVTEEELRIMVDECQESGEIENSTKSLLDNVFNFDDLTVGEIITHRKDLTAVSDNTTVRRLVELAANSGYSRIPVYRDSIDNIIGIVYVKDLLRYITDKENIDKPLDKSLIREAIFVPKTKSCVQMFDYMTKNHKQIAVVVDEYGGTNGIITMEDLVEVILGNIQDEYDHEVDAIEQVDENSFTVDGSTDLDEVSALVGQKIESEVSDTIAGLMLERMGHIPKENEHPSVVINGIRFTVQKVHERRIERVLVVKK